MAHATNGRHTDNWWLEAIGSAVTQDANGVGTITVSGGSTTTPGGTAPTTVTPVGAIARDTSTKVTRTDGTSSSMITDLQENQWVRESYAPVAEDNTVGVIKVEQRFSNTYISTATTTVVKSGSGMLHSLVINGGTTGTITIYDNTAASGTNLAVFDTTNALATYTFDCTFATGLTIVTSAATKISVNWR